MSLYDGPIGTLVHRSDGVLVFERRSQGRMEVEELRPHVDDLLAAVARASAEGARFLIVDLRYVRGRNEPAWEREISIPFNERLRELLDATAWVVKTSIGILQAQRYAMEHGIAVRAFREVEEAANWLTRE